MKLMAPVSRVGEAEALINAGADELYCGLIPKAWEDSFTFINSMNARHTKGANLCDVSELKELIGIASARSVPVHLTLNSHYYTSKQLPIVLTLLEDAVSAGLGYVIVADASLMRVISERGFDVKLGVSTCSPVFNSSALEFFAGLGAERVLLPRQLTLDEVRSLREKASALGMELEAFVLNTQCPYIDGLCTYQHVFDADLGVGDSLACRMRYDVRVTQKKKTRNPSLARVAGQKVKAWAGSIPQDCGLCALYDFKRTGLDGVKIAGREFDAGKKIKDVAAVRSALDLLEKGISFEDFKREMNSLYSGLFSQRCGSINCYYPEAGKW